MRIGQRVKWESKYHKGVWFSGTLVCFEYDKKGWALVKCDKDPPGREPVPVTRERLLAFTPPAKFSAKGGGDNPSGTAALLAEAA